MKWGFAGLGALLLGIFTFVGIVMFVDATIINEEDYYSLKEAMAAAMYDSIDIDYYQKTGEIKIIQEKFVEVFTRRFIENTSYGKQGYKLEFYDIIESPPKASIRIYGQTDEYNISLDSDEFLSYDIINELDGILLYSGNHIYSYDYYYAQEVKTTRNKKYLQGFLVSDLDTPKALENKNNCKVVKIEYTSSMTQTDADIYSTYRTNKYNTILGDTIWGNSKTISTTPLTPFCEIETMNKFVFNNNKVDNIEITLLNCNKSKPITGIKYKVTWMCNG